MTPFAVTWVGPEIIILSKSDRQTSRDTIYMWNLEYDIYTNELIEKTGIDLQTQKKNFTVIKGENGRGTNKEFGVNRYGIRNR